MNQQQDFNPPPNFNQQQELPNATATLVLGICSIVFSCFILGIILSIIGLAISGNSKKLYKQNPMMYSNYGTLNAGRILSIIGLILGIISVLYVIFAFIFVGTLDLPWEEILEGMDY